MKFALLLSALLPSTFMAQQTDWFADAKLGIFIHWGMYAVDGTSESWAFHNETVPYATYMRQMNGFSAAKYNPNQWAKLIKESGARYCVITTKHHDGLALYNTQIKTPQAPHQKNWNPKYPLSTKYQTPAKQDLISPLFTSLRQEQLKVGAYYSLLDWSSFDYPTFLKDSSRYQINDEPKRWNNFLTFMHGQIAEINTQLRPDLFWFDGDWEHSEIEWQAAQIDSIIHQSNPNAILNGRLHSFGNYDTPEQNMPITHPSRPIWELCLTTNDNWGYRPLDNNYKTPFELLCIFSECLGMGGNLLLDIGPKADGTFPDEQVKILQEFGRWTSKHQSAIYGTSAGIPYGHYHGNSTLSKDSLVLNLFVPSPQGSDLHASNKMLPIYMKGLKNKPSMIELIGSSTPLAVSEVGKISWSEVPGTLFIQIPISEMDPMISVIQLTFNEPIELYRGKGGFH